MRAAYCTLGCKVNQYDTEAMRELMEDAGYETVAFDEIADVYIINTCTVTATGDKKSRQMISRAHGRNPNACVVVAGCYSQRAPEEVLSLPGVAVALGTSDRREIVARVNAAISGGAAQDEKTDKTNTENGFEPLSATREGRTRAHLKIQEGCDRYCTYCIIPYARGPVRSRPPEGIREELIKLAQAGFKEVVLTGIHLMSYGKDLCGDIGLTDAIAQARDVEGIERIRLGSLEPQLLSGDVVSALSDNPKICRHFHLSLQSGSAGVLKRMNRRYTPDEYAECVRRLRQAMPLCAITTDVIVGFPGETEQEFAQTMEFVEKMKLARLHVFPYSRREGTAAAGMPGQLPQKVKAERAAELIALGEALEREYLSGFIGRREKVLVEETDDSGAYGYTDTYARVKILSGSNSLCNHICDADIIGLEGNCLNAKLVLRED